MRLNVSIAETISCDKFPLTVKDIRSWLGQAPGYVLTGLQASGFLGIWKGIPSNAVGAVSPDLGPAT